MSKLDPLATERAEHHREMERKTRLVDDMHAAGLLAAVVAALPEMQRTGVRRLTIGALTVELDRVQIASDDDADRAADDAGDRATLPPQPEPGESDDLDLAAVDG
jgi:hypothetical protein